MPTTPTATGGARPRRRPPMRMSRRCEAFGWPPPRTRRPTAADTEHVHRVLARQRRANRRPGAESRYTFFRF